MMEEKKLTPQLRFPEFDRASEWQLQPLRKVLIKNSKKNKSLKHNLVQSVSNKHGFINQEDYFDNRRVASKDTSNYYVIKKGYFAYNPSRIDVGSLAYQHENITSIISPLYVSFQANYEEVDDIFLLNWFFSDQFSSQLIFEGGVRNTLSYENLVQINITLPSLPEQQKIASCLSSLDELIAAHKDKLDALKDHKKGLLQNLFPQEGETVPKVRFPEFEDDGEWDNKPISKLGETVNGLSGKKGADFGSGRPYVQYKQVFDKSFIDFTECGKVDVGENENQNQLQLGDILFTTSSETPDEVGFASVINKQPEEPTYLNSFCFILRPNDLNEINPGFSRYLFHSPIYRKSVSAIAQGSTRYNLSKKAFLKLRVPVPSTPEEQQKIASCLSALDELIMAQAEKIEQLKMHKKGLMQGLFPSAV